MKPLVRSVMAVSGVCLLHGCATGSFNSEVDTTQRHIQSLDQRVSQLETSRGGGTPASTETAPVSNAETGDESRGPSGSWFRSSGALTKLGRGAVNTVTGWVEIPKRMVETSQRSGALTGFTWGLLRGLGHGFIRTVGGIYEVVTFPFPAPSEYRSVIQPEYVFL